MGLNPLSQETVQARNGIIDLRNVPVAEQEIALEGTWKWYWKQLRKPGDPPSPSELISFPKLWSESKWGGQPVGNQGYATYELIILVRPRERPLALRIPDLYTAYRIYLNGKEAARNGSPGISAETTRPFWSTHLEILPADTDTLHLLMQVANFQHSKGGPNKPIILGDADRLQQGLNVNYALDFILTGCLFMGGLFFLGLYLFGRHEKSVLYFSLFCLVYSYRIIGSDHYVLHTLLRDSGWNLTVHLEYLSLFLGVALFVRYTASLYPEDVNHRIMGAMAGLCYTFSAVTLAAPPVIFTRLINLFLVLMFLYIGYAFYVYQLAARRKRPGAEYALMSTGVLLAVFIIIIFKYFGIAFPENTVLFTGYLGFFFLQSLVLSYRFAFALRTAKEQAEEGLKAKSEFLSTMSHEIRTPLNAVIGMTHLLLEDQPRPDQKQHLDVLLFSANNLLNIVNDILDFNKIEAGKIQLEAIPMDLAGILKNIVAGYRTSADEKKIDLKLDLDPGFRTRVVGDPTRLTQVVSNLVHNAIKFTETGEVRVSLAVEDRRANQITVTLKVQDTGIGIASDKQELIFNRFTQADSSMSRSYGGTGLGLSICRRLLELQNVSLRLTSTPGTGSAFYFTQTFPTVDTPAEQPAEDKKPIWEGKPLEGLSLLLVEDNAMNVLLATKLLTRMGATLDVANNGLQALEKLDTARHRLILMDLQMPIMDGYEASRRLRDRGETLPILALTASLEEEIGDRVRASGMNGILVKPFNPNDLLGIILKYTKPTPTS